MMLVTLLLPVMGVLPVQAAPSGSAAETLVLRSPVPSEPLCSLEITIENMSGSEGQLRVSVFKTKDGFPGKHERALVAKVFDASIRTLVLDSLPCGPTAVAMHHDRDGNGMLNTNIIGIPSEDVGVSNDPKVRFGPPLFEEAVFSLKMERQKLSINMKH